LISKALTIVFVLSILFFPISAPLALIAGILLVLTLGNPYPEKLGRWTSLLLKTAIVGLGFGIDVDTALQASQEGLLLTIATIVTAIVLGWFLGKRLKVDQKLAFLLSSGTAICGGSAIAAVAPVINAEQEKISVSLGIVFLFNAVALLIFPYIGEYLNMDQQAFGTWAAVAIHDTSSVVGAAKVYGDSALEVATSVKLARTLWIIPLTLLAGAAFGGDRKRIKMPVFIALFIGAILIGTYIPDNTPIAILSETIPAFAKKLMVVAIFFTGAGLSISNIKKSGPRSFVTGALIWIVIAVGSYLWLAYL
jgi:uncharacterized integral membrane protein (TIGR00698 family)